MCYRGGTLTGGHRAWCAPLPHSLFLPVTRPCMFPQNSRERTWFYHMYSNRWEISEPMIDEFGLVGCYIYIPGTTSRGRGFGCRRSSRPRSTRRCRNSSPVASSRMERRKSYYLRSLTTSCTRIRAVFPNQSFLEKAKRNECNLPYNPESTPIGPLIFCVLLGWGRYGRC